MKRCSKCRETKPRDDFHRAQSYCKPCMSAYAKQWRKTYYRGDRTPESKQSRLRQYGLTKSEYRAMVEEQERRCAICSEEFRATPHIDHCHTTGRVRGLLCGPCNKGLGHFRDNPSLTLRATEYLCR